MRVEGRGRGRETEAERGRDREWKGTLCSPKKPRRELVGSGSSPFFPGKAKREKKIWKTRKISKINYIEKKILSDRINKGFYFLKKKKEKEQSDVHSRRSAIQAHKIFPSGPK